MGSLLLFLAPHTILHCESGIMVHACNPRTWKEKAKEPGGQILSYLLTSKPESSLGYRRPCGFVHVGVHAQRQPLSSVPLHFTLGQGLA